MNIDDGAVIVAYAVYLPATSVTPANLNGNFTFSFQILGEAYPWYEKLFLGKPRWHYYLGVSGFCLATALVLILIALPCIICCFRFLRKRQNNTVKLEEKQHTSQKGGPDKFNNDFNQKAGEHYKKKIKDRVPIVVDQLDTEPN